MCLWWKEEEWYDEEEGEFEGKGHIGEMRVFGFVCSSFITAASHDLFIF